MTDTDANGEGEGAREAADDAWLADLRRARAEKDEFFASDPQSPLPPDERESFEGLAYFEPDPAYRVEADVTVHEEPEAVEMTVRNGTAQRFRRVATFAFELPDAEGEPVEQTLGAYRAADSAALFVPFRDKTTGQQTYDGGRYMDLHPEGELAESETVTVDFNLAYTPFCAYADAFACPLPPSENWLDVAVPAGERDPPV